jgi:NADPH-dependent 2,4-dienoyl-CoA reductase/sulfur reductase-like enzyme
LIQSDAPLLQRLKKWKALFYHRKVRILDDVTGGQRGHRNQPLSKDGCAKGTTVPTQNYDIITVGGGIAASALAETMAERGARVSVLERETKFEDRVRGEGLVCWGGGEARELGIYELPVLSLSECEREP